MFGGTRARSDKWQKRPLELATQLSKHSWKNSRCCVQDLKWYPKGSMPGKYCFKNKELYINKKSLCKYIYINIELPRCRFSTQASQQVRKKQRINSFETYSQPRPLRSSSCLPKKVQLTATHNGMKSNIRTHQSINGCEQGPEVRRRVSWTSKTSTSWKANLKL